MLAQSRILVLIFIASASIVSAQISAPWHYTLRSGDHLVYGYSIHREIEDKAKEDRSLVNLRFRTQVLVLGENSGRITLGFQRNREAANLTASTSHGKDKLAHELPDFQKRLAARPTRFSEAMIVSPTGDATYAWEIARETSSHLLDALHEIMPLPPITPHKGETWHGAAYSGFDLRWIDDQSIHGHSCHRIEATPSQGSFKITYCWSSESGVIEQVIFDGSYQSFSSTVHETATMDLESNTHNESLGNWLASPDTRQAALQAVLLDPAIPVSATQLTTPLSSDEVTTQSLGLAVTLHRKIDLPAAVLTNVRQSKSSLIQTELQDLADAQPNTSAAPKFDECHRSLAVKSPPAKFGTSFEIAPSTAETPETPYLLRVPLSYSTDHPSPLLIYLSGGAGFAVDALNTADPLASTDFIVLYPQAAALWWSPEVTHHFYAAFHDVLNRYNVARDRIYITGFSNGGTGALYYAALWPDRFSAVVTLMGAGQCMDAVKAVIGNVKNLPIFLLHGADDPVITPDCSSTTQIAIKDLHPAIAPELKILPKHGHDITLENDEGLTLPFFQNKIRNPFPRTVDFTVTDALSTRAYWVEILDAKVGKSDIDVRIKPDNTIDIHSHAVKKIRLHLRPELFLRPGDYHVVWNGKKIFGGPLRDACSQPASSVIADPKFDIADIRDFELP